MKKALGIVLGTMLLSSVAFAHGCCNCCCSCNSDGHHKMMKKKQKKMMQKRSMQKVQPQNIDKNNVGVTSGEDADQTDPTLIEGNLENNDFKN